jgi:YHS domain-containing protein
MNISVRSVPRVLVVTMLAVASLTGVGCGNETPKAKDGTAAAGLKAPGEAGIGDRTTCLISKEEFTVTAESPKAEYKGKTYYFCCPGCDGKFKADPAKYVTPAT